MIGFGIAQRTVFLEPDRVSLSADVTDEAADFIVVAPDALAAHAGKQTLTVSGSPEVFLSYGRTSDVQAWLADAPYTSVHYDAEADALVSELVVGEPDDATTPPVDTAEVPAGVEAEAEAAATPPPSPVGSDLWLDEFG